MREGVWDPGGTHYSAPTNITQGDTSVARQHSKHHYLHFRHKGLGQLLPSWIIKSQVVGVLGPGEEVTSSEQVSTNTGRQVVSGHLV